MGKSAIFLCFVLLMTMVITTPGIYHSPLTAAGYQHHPSLQL